VSHLIENGVNAVGISPCLNVPGLMAHGGDEYNGATLLVESICETLSAGLVPVIHGDAGLYGKFCNPRTSMYHHQSMSAGILGGDTLVEIIATHPSINKRISKTVFLTDVEGVFTKDPKTFPDATLVRNIWIDPLSGKVMNEVSASGSSHEHDVTGGLEVCNTNFVALASWYSFSFYQLLTSLRNFLLHTHITI
jgi:isopentenyl phosphate kinase